MTDRELLEAAANANGLPWKWVKVPAYATEVPGILMRDHANEVDYYPGWNPLADDGDALRLAVKLLIDVDQGEIGTTNGKPAAIAHYRFTLKSGQVAWNSRSELHETDPYAATRRAIVRAAAAIGAHKEGA